MSGLSVPSNVPGLSIPFNVSGLTTPATVWLNADPPTAQPTGAVALRTTPGWLETFNAWSSLFSFVKGLGVIFGWWPDGQQEKPKTRPHYTPGETPDDVPIYTKVNFWIGNDGPHPFDPTKPPMINAGGDAPDVHLFGDGGNHIGSRYRPGFCPSGSIHCYAGVDTEGYASYVLLSGNMNPTCIALMTVEIPGVERKFGFALGNWAAPCEKISGRKNPWYYANQDLPLKSAVNDVSKCVWIGRGKDNQKPKYLSGMQLRMREFRSNEAPIRKMDYYCRNYPVLNFRTETYPHVVQKWAIDPLLAGTKAPTGPFLDPQWATETEDMEESETLVTEPLPTVTAMGTFGDAAVKERNRNRYARLARRWISSPDLVEQIAMDPSVYKSHKPGHLASELCDRNAGAVGHSFVSYAEKMFCYMPTKTLYKFCEDIDEGACWSEDDNKVIVKASGAGMMTLSAADIPDLRHAHSSMNIVWK
ncbi:hypothetical protein K456DRAFT_1724384 [Colletotrichum gloeosporioides 23]|nr:hypothetical protein K456DRAFT_1724384 [Colletotrichum gloeosporioides 23]KAJ0273181.1 hypothetical protein COL940_010026 [Colletotrichum noveboracense]